MARSISQKALDLNIKKRSYTQLKDSLNPKLVNVKQKMAKISAEL